jgi:hypothetical protein
LAPIGCTLVYPTLGPAYPRLQYLPQTGADAASIGFAIDQMIAAPGDRGVLFDSVRGLFLLAADDKITQLESRGGQFTRALARQRAAGGD